MTNILTFRGHVSKGKPISCKPQPALTSGIKDESLIDTTRNPPHHHDRHDCTAMLVPTGTASLVLHSQLPDVDVSSLAQQVVAFMFPPPTWRMAFSDRHTEETCLADLQYLHAQQIPECDVRHGRRGRLFLLYWGCTFMDEAAARGFLSVVQFLHKHSQIGCTKEAMVGASHNGHLQVLRYLHEVVNADVCSRAWGGAAENGHLQVLQYLHQVHLDLPEAKRTESRSWGRYPLVAAAKRNNWEMLKWLYANRPERCAEKVLVEAASSGSAELVVFLYENGDAYDCGIMVSETARTGRLDLIQCFHFQSTGRGFTSSTMNEAAINGHLDVVQFLDTHRQEGCTQYGINQAAINGHLDVIQYIYENRTERCKSITLDKAACNGHLEVVQFLYRNRRKGWYVSRSVSRKTIHRVIKSGHADVLQYLVDQSLVKLDPEDFTLIPRGNVQMIKCVYDNCVVHAGDQRLPLLTSVLISAMERREGDLSLDIVQCLDSLRLPGDVFVSKAMDTAAVWGDLKLVQYLHAHGHAGCTTKAMDDAATQSRLDIIQYLHENRTEGCTTAAMDKAAEKGRLEIVQFLHENRSEGCTTEAMDRAACKGHLDIVQFLHENRPEGCTIAAIDKAAQNGHLDIVQFLHENRLEGCTTYALASAFRRRHYAVVAFLLRHRTEGCGRPVLTFLTEEGCLDMLQSVFATRTEKDCVHQALESARNARCPTRKRQAMVAYLESQLPCTCRVCSGELRSL